MEETAILEKTKQSDSCYLDLNQVLFGPLGPSRMQTMPGDLACNSLKHKRRALNDRILEPGLEKSEKRGVQAARDCPSPPPTPAGGPVARPEMSTADRLGSRERADGATHFVAPTSAS